MPGDSSGSSSYPFYPSRYDERDALRFKAERDETLRELEDVSGRPESPNSNGSTSASSCWRPSTVNPLICFNLTQL
jgi:hypothetical protein